ncbi:MAG: transglycosylase SLT domain-containing protein [Tannerella sp.]|jgi:membrane-bound lytic murein transglycosylase F|nr:transglycosylase SLT domain-containing protein [Tannerella sp.]
MFSKQLYVFFLLLLLSSCYGNRRKEKEVAPSDFPALLAKGEMTAVTLNSSTAYFQYKMQPMGYEYDLITDFARSHKLKLNIKVAENVTRLTEMLHSGEADVVAYPIQIDNRLKQEVLFCGHEQQSNLVIVQRTNRGDTTLTDVTQLIGKEVYVKSNTRYHERLEHLNMELGGGIHIRDVERDTVTTEDLIEMVSRGLIAYTVCEDDVARLNRTYFRNINIDLAISFKQRSSWVVRKSNPLLAKAINEWASDKTGENTYLAASKRYFELSKSYPSGINVPKIINGQISPYDNLFRQYAPQLGWDWQLLASVAYQESHFEPDIVSWSGAEGLMGIMPATSEYLGYQPEEMQDPEKCIQAGIKCLYRFGQTFTETPDSLERIKLTLASYNAGVGHIADAQRLAKKYGKNPDIWNDHVADFIRLKSEPEYYTDSVCKHGYLRGNETLNYVAEVLARYLYYKEATKN